MKKRIITLDLIKIVSISLIIFHHYQQVFKCRFPGINFFGGFFYFGNLVELFFIISGFLTMYTEQRKDNINPFNGFLHKIMNIYPMAALSIFASLILKTLLSIQLNTNELKNLWNIKSLVANFLLLFSGYPYFRMPGFNNPLWYICVLIQCYAVFYLIKCISKGNNVMKNVTYILIIIFSLFFLHCINIGYINNFRGFSSFYLGIILYLTRKYIFEKYSNNIVPITLISLFISIFSTFLLLFSDKHKLILQLVSYPSMVFSLSNFRIRKLNIIDLFAKLSFIAYVWHCPLLFFVQVISLLFNINIQHSYITMLAFLLFVWFFSFVLYKYLQTPIRRKIKHIRQVNRIIIQD